MTRINTNVGSLVAQNTLARSNAQLQESLTRLSTGLRINTGKDDPAGLIASEALRSDIISVEKAITNNERASQLIATADSALGQVSALLNDIRGLVSEAANTGALSAEQIDANQLQVDSSLEAIDRISQITSFQGRKVLDGSLDFITQGVDTSKVQGLKIDQANFGNLSQITVSVDVVKQASKGELNFGFSAVGTAGAILEVGGSNGTEVFNFAAGSSIEDVASSINLVSDATGVEATIDQKATTGAITVSSLGLDNDILLNANNAGFDAGNVNVQFSLGTTTTSASFTAASGNNPGTLNVSLRTTTAAAAAGDVDDSSTLTKATGTLVSAGGNNDVSFTATQAGAVGNDIDVIFDTTGGGTPTVVYDQTNKTLTVKSDGTTTANEIVQLVNQDTNVSNFVTAAVAEGDGTGNVVSNSLAPLSLSGAKGDIDNAIKFTATHTGTAFNDTSVNYVNGNGTAAGVESADRKAALLQELDSGGTDSGVTFTAKKNGASQNFANGGVRIVFGASDNGASQTTVGVAVDGNTITLDYNSNVGNESQAADIINAIRGDAAASALVDIVLTGGTSNADIDFTGNVDLVGGGGTAERNEYIEYAGSGKAAQAALTLTGANNDILITATSKGTSLNDVQVDLVSAASGLGTANAIASYNSTSKVLTLTIDSGDSTTRADLIAAINSQVTEFSAAEDNSVDTTGSAAINDSNNASDIANTSNTGGDAGTVFVYIEEGVSTAGTINNRLATAAADNGSLLDGVSRNNLTARAAENFTTTNVPDNDGSGRLFAGTFSKAIAGGVNGGDVAADAAEVIAALTASTTVSAVLTASLATGDDGKNVAVSAFQEFAYSGSAASNNRVQFLGLDNAKNIRFVAPTSASQALAITDTRGNASAIKDSDAADSALLFTANQTGGEFDGTRVVYVDDIDVTAGNEIVSYNADDKILKISINSGTTTAEQVRAAVAADEYVNQFFSASNFGTSTGGGAVDADLQNAAFTTVGGANADVTVTATTPGTAGNSLLVDVNVGAATTSVAFSGSTLTVNVVAATTAAQTAAIINSSSVAQANGFSATFEGNGSATVTDSTGAQSLSGGIGTESAAGSGVPTAVTGDLTFTGGLGDTLILSLATDASGIVTTTAGDLLTFFDATANQALLGEYGISASNAEGSNGNGLIAATTTDITFGDTGINLDDAQAAGTSIAQNGINARIKVTAVTKGSSFEGVTVKLQNDDTLTAGNETAAYDVASKTLTVKIDAGSTTANQVIAAITSDVSDLFTVAVGTGGDGTAKVTEKDTLTLTGGVVESGTANGAALLGNADSASTGLKLSTTQFGSSAFIQVTALQGSFDLTDSTGSVANRSTGTDVNARINGIQAIGRGLQATINTSGLDLSFSLAETVVDGENVKFTINGGGAQFQLGPDVVSNQQARLGIRAVNTARLGGVSGKLFELRSGGGRALSVDTSGAARIVEEAITDITGLRGRLGAFQATTLQSNIFTLNDTLANLTDAESSIRDADFAEESAKLTRSQILVQSGISVLSIANSNPQNVLQLLR